MSKDSNLTMDKLLEDNDVKQLETGDVINGVVILLRNMKFG